jgi:hypothetical protein
MAVITARSANASQVPRKREREYHSARLVCSEISVAMASRSAIELPFKLRHLCCQLLNLNLQGIALTT